MTVRTAVYADLDMKFTRNTSGDVTRDTDIDAVISSLSNIVATLQGGRRMLPEFAQDIWALLFDPMDEDTARILGERLLEAIDIWEDRVKVIRINIDPDWDSNQYNVSMEFRIKRLEEAQTIDFILFAQ